YRPILFGGPASRDSSLRRGRERSGDSQITITDCCRQVIGPRLLATPYRQSQGANAPEIGVPFLENSILPGTRRTTSRLELHLAMKTTIKAIAVTIAGSVALPLSSFAKGHEEIPVQMADLPTAVQDTIKEKAGSNEIVRIAKETHHGKTVYDA